MDFSNNPVSQVYPPAIRKKSGQAVLYASIQEGMVGAERINGRYHRLRNSVHFVVKVICMSSKFFQDGL